MTEEIEIPLASTDKYEEALSKARFEYKENPCASESEKKLLEIIFPELRESELERAARGYALRVDMGTCGELVIPAFIDGAKWQERQKGQKLVEHHEEDEKIREGLLRHFKNKTKPYWNGIAVKDIIAYLEKQKEQIINHKGLHKGSLRHVDNPTKWMKEDDMEREQKPARWRPISECGDIPDGHYVVGAFRFGEFRLGIMCNGAFVDPNGNRAEQPKEVFYIPNADEKLMYEKIMESDPDAIEKTPKQDYSGLTDFERAIHRGFLCAGVENVPVSIIKQTADEAGQRIKIVDCDNNTAFNYGFKCGRKQTLEEQKPAMVNKEDDAVTKQFVLNQLFSLKEHINFGRSWEYIPLIDGLIKAISESIAVITPNEELPNEKPAEWSEEDEQCRQFAIQGLNSYIKEHPDSEFGNPTACEKLAIDWLKSLRPQPHWKPSEEQMNALCRMKINIPTSNCDSTLLETLYTDLLELMQYDTR